MVQNFKIRGDIKLLPKREEQTSPSINYSMLCYAMLWSAMKFEPKKASTHFKDI